MSYCHVEPVVVTCGATNNGTGYSEVVNGHVSQIRYVKPNSGGYASNPDFDVTVETTGEVLWDEDNVDASTTRAPRQATHSTLGAAALYAAGGTAVNDKIAVANSRILVSVTAGGNGNTGTFYITID